MKVMKRVAVEKQVLAGNQHYANKNKEKFSNSRTLAMNLISSPGAGKTTLLEKSLRELSNHLRVGVIEGDIETSLDAERVSKYVKAVQINTHGACHLDARMIHDALDSFSLKELDLLMVENVGNLVCPAAFDLGEHQTVALLSVTEGADKVLKYPAIFRKADAVVINKIDLLPYVSFDLPAFKRDVKSINPGVCMFEVSAIEGEGVNAWTQWLLKLTALYKEKE